MLKGVPVSPGIVVARAYCVDEVLAQLEPRHVDGTAVSGEVTRLENAIAAAGKELDAIVARVTRQLGEDEAAIFRGHRLLLRDPALIAKVKTIIFNKHLDARSAIQETLDEYTKLFEKIQDEYLKERMADIRDVAQRIMAHLALDQAPSPCLECDEPVILVAPEVLPSQVMIFQRLKIVGIITEAGGSTGHAAILARSQSIPLVSGLRGIHRACKTGDLIALDGRMGHVYLRPDAEIEAAYRKLQREFVDMRDRLVENRDLEPVTKDGTRVELLANVNNQADAEMALRSGATGVGLYRTEYLFLTHATVPDEEEQLAAYRGVIESAPNRTVTIRTLDLGGDKLVPYFGHQKEANPFLGWRSIRLLSAYPQFFQTQLRAILRASLHGRVSLMFPMITTLEEVQKLKHMLQRTKAQLLREGVPFNAELPVGIMLEVPAAAFTIHALLREVDFISIGSNDLIQYLMAADRDNPKVAHLCEPFSPPVLRILNHILKACVKHNKPVTLCGEMAGRSRCFLPLLGMGLRRFSMSPAFVPNVKELARNADLAVGIQVARHALRLHTIREVRQYLTRVARKVCPNVTFLETRK